MRAMKHGYARVSTDDQNPALQLAALKKAGCKTVFKDEGLSGATTKRPALLRCLKKLQPVAASWDALRAKFPRAKIVNFSATPTRADGQLMAGRILYSYPVSRAIQEGYIKRLKAVVLNPRTLRYVRRADGQEIEVSLDEVRQLGCRQQWVTCQRDGRLSGAAAPMPKRIVDGDALWRSKKLGQVEPAAFRAEYANLIPLALANGTFEADPRLVWATVYAYNRPDITHADVEAVLAEFRRAKMLFTWRDPSDGKEWGYWVGIERPGRLPGKSRHGTNERVGAAVPEDELRKFLDSNCIHTEESGLENSPDGSEKLLGFGSGLGSGIGSGEGNTIAHSSNEREFAAPVDGADSSQSQEPQKSGSLAQSTKDSKLVTANRAGPASKIYSAYTRKVGKADALRAIAKAIRIIANRSSGENHPDFAGDEEKAAAWLQSRVELYAKSPSVQETDNSLIPYPATWFNDGRYDDDEVEWNRRAPIWQETRSTITDGSTDRQLGRCHAKSSCSSLDERGGVMNGDFGKTVTHSNENCEKHGPYTADVITLKGLGIGGCKTKCPVCEDQQEQKRRADEVIELARIKAKQVASKRNAAGIPRRGFECSFDNFVVTTEEQKKALGTARSFAENFDSVLKTGSNLLFCGSPGTGKTHLAVRGSSG